MAKHLQHHASVEAPLELDGGLAELRDDCALMAPHWTAVAPVGSAPLPPSRISGLARIIVPPASAALLSGMSEYGD
ncbi:hypothetical protein AB0M28_40200 [Streptomyces sp. NPDC051940]|uniref:hypothetical protein n=1 Tax=Streptomyces sp. NPDC051940 TaxID=3155675 RepID=UPI0034422600